jgi:hypothetical protein
MAPVSGYLPVSEGLAAMGAVERRSATWSAVEVSYCKEMRKFSLSLQKGRNVAAAKVAQHAEREGGAQWQRTKQRLWCVVRWCGIGASCAWGLYL